MGLSMAPWLPVLLWSLQLLLSLMSLSTESTRFLATKNEAQTTQAYQLLLQFGSNAICGGAGGGGVILLSTVTDSAVGGLLWAWVNTNQTKMASEHPNKDQHTNWNNRLPADMSHRKQC